MFLLPPFLPPHPSAPSMNPLRGSNVPHRHGPASQSKLVSSSSSKLGSRALQRGPFTQRAVERDSASSSPVTSASSSSASTSTTLPLSLSARPHLVIEGNRPLHGFAPVAGAKNSALALMAAALLSDSAPLYLRGVPLLTDILAMADVLRSLGCHVSYHPSDNDPCIGTLEIDPSNVSTTVPDPDGVRRLRASFLVAGPLLARHGAATVALPGGCDIGRRPVDMHLMGLSALGATCEEVVTSADELARAGGGGAEFAPRGPAAAAARSGGHASSSSRSPSPSPGPLMAVTMAGKLRGARVRLPYPSVGATETVLMAAVLAEGASLIENAAREPEVVDLARLLRTMGARISGEGTASIHVEGVPRLTGADVSVIPDRIEAGTLMLAGASAGSTVTIGPVIESHMGPLSDILTRMGCELAFQSRSPSPGLPLKGQSAPLSDVTVRAPRVGTRLRSPGHISTGPFPAFPTDLQPLLVPVLAQSDGPCRVEERVFESRLGYVAQLQLMGARIRVLPGGCEAVVEGADGLRGADVEGGDLRACAALVLAALGAQGPSRVFGLEHLDRGYAGLEGKLVGLGAQIRRLGA